MRIDKYLSNAGYGSRKDIKIMIKQKRIKHMHTIISDPAYKITPGTDITIDDENITIVINSTIMMHKPLGYLSSNDGDSDYPSIMELLTEPHPVYHIAGRLDVDTTGLMILSTDGKLIHRIISPKKEVQKLYIATVLPFDKEKIDKFHNGIRIDEDFIAKPVTHFEILNETSELLTIKIGITEGKYHQIKKMFMAVGSRVVTLHRCSIGSLNLDVSLAEGEYRELNEREVEMLFQVPQED